MVNDPVTSRVTALSTGVNKQEAAKKREKLFNILRELVKWENTNNEAVLNPNARGHHGELARNLRP